MVHTNDKTRKRFLLLPKLPVCRRTRVCRKEECIASVHFVHKNIHNFRFRRKIKKKTFESFFVLFFFSLVGFKCIFLYKEPSDALPQRSTFSANRLRSLLTEERIYTTSTTTATNVESSIKHIYTCIYAFGFFFNNPIMWNCSISSSVFVVRFLGGISRCLKIKSENSEIDNRFSC